MAAVGRQAGTRHRTRPKRVTSLPVASRLIARFACLAPDLCVFPPGRLLWRVYARNGNHPTTWDAFRYYGPTTSRFDPHLAPARPQARGIMYVAENGTTCLAEVFQDARTINRTRSQPWLVGFRTRRAITLLDMRGNWPTQAGGSQAICTGDRRRARRWSQAIYDAYPAIEGIIYPSKMHGGNISLAFYERAATVLPSIPDFNRALADDEVSAMLKNAASVLNYKLL
ncbi:MAG: RES family NAD+ phosphorylase [Thermomicrobiales bacterium]